MIILKIEYMLNLITKSKIRQKIILLFVYNPDKEYYINEIARLIRTSAGNVQRELKKLSESNFLAKKRKGNMVYFKIDDSNPLLLDIKSIVDKTIGLQYILEKELQKTKGINFAFLFGSYVKGDFDRNSDIDLYVIGEISDRELYRKIRKADEKINREINYHLSTRKEFKKNLKKSFFYKEILSEHILIIGDKNEFRKFIR